MGYIQLSEMKMGDVLLFHSETLIPSRAIQFFDHTDWNHSGLYWGRVEENPHNVAESIASGVGVHTLKESIGDNTRILVCRLKENVADMTPVLERAQSYVGHPYAFQDMVLLALICIIRRVSINPIFDNLIRIILDEAALALDNLLTVGMNEQPMICSSFVFRSYNEAKPEPDDKYTIHIAQESGSPSQHLYTAAAGKAPGVLGPLAAPKSSRMRGAGIHPKSILARALQDQKIPEVKRGSFRTHTQEASEVSALHEEAPYIANKSIETCFQEYRKMLRSTPTQTDSGDKQISPELRASLQRFSAKYYAADTKSTPKESTEPSTVRSLGRSESQLSIDPVPQDPVEFVASTVANFVTPGDLFRSQDLYAVGELDLKSLDT